MSGRRSSLRLANWVIASLFVGSLCFYGCGKADVRKYHVWGTVMYRGKPVPAGSVMFVPDGSKGNSGPAVSLKIKEGRYDSRTEGVGHIGGPHKVRITGLSGESSGDEYFPEGTLLFPEYEVSVDLGQESGEQNLVVPDSWVLPPIKVEPPTGP